MCLVFMIKVPSSASASVDVQMHIFLSLHYSELAISIAGAQYYLFSITLLLLLHDTTLLLQYRPMLIKSFRCGEAAKRELLQEP